MVLVMIVDARSLPPGEQIVAQVCIVGAGAAGITLGREFARSEVETCILESGGLEIDAVTQDLNAGEVTGENLHSLDVARLRYLGGSTNHWSGFCRPLDSLDFESRKYLPDSGWPFGQDVLEPYYRRAQSICQLGAYGYEAENWQTEDYIPFRLDPSRIVSGIIQLSPPTRFGETYRADIQDSPSLKTLLHANVTQIVLEDASVKELRVACLDGKAFTVRARMFVLAAGAIENSRILLYPNSARPAGIGNTYDNVGRYFMDHPVIWRSGGIVTRGSHKEAVFYTPQLVNGFPVIGAFYPSSAIQRLEGLPNCGIDLEPVNLSAQSTGITSAKSVWRDLWDGKMPSNLGSHVGRMLQDFDDLADAGYRKIVRPPPKQFTTRFWSECAPNRQSRVSLIADKDALGLPRVKLDWRFDRELYHRTFRRMHELLGHELGRHNIGRLRVREDRDESSLFDSIEDSFHHMGTTRMHENPRQGVVDANCRVHETNNLYVAGSSVFPSFGQANPTLTIVALTIRLADHVKSLL
jgi:choline dehydrogenase-like flavoprotein